MNIFVCIKQVPDTETKIVPSQDGKFIETNSIKWIMNPYDEFAVEQALQVKTANSGSTVTVIRVGKIHDTEALRTALAMGADEAILVETEDNLDSYMTSKSIKGAIEKSGKNPDLILTGKQAIDDDCLQVPQLLAQMMNIPSVSVVVGFEQAGSQLTLKREIEGGAIEIYEVQSPVVVACNKGINTPRYASLPGIMKAKRKPLAKHSLADVGVNNDDRRVYYSNFSLPPEKPPGKTFDATDENKQASVVQEVVQLLRNEAKVI
jgi:electron transfer flavoprotein beta subunit